ncbi:hypothetical protein, partial [Escherichia coli]
HCVVMHEEWQGSIFKNTRVNRNTFIVEHIYPPHIIKIKRPPSEVLAFCLSYLKCHEKVKNRHASG